MTGLWERINYKSGFPYVFSRFIREYDIRKANISILYEKGILSYKEYIYFYNADRMERQVYIGKLEKRNPKVVKILQDGIIEAKRKLFIENKISPEDILCIKNDAVFTIDKILNKTKFGIVEFVQKHEYTSYMNILGIEFFYGYNKVNKIEDACVKGLGKSEYLHKDYLTDFIFYILNQIQTEDIESVLNDFNLFYKQYQNFELNAGYYREYNSESMYSIINSDFKLSNINDTIDNKRCINGGYNLNILRIIYQYITGVYFNKNK